MIPCAPIQHLAPDRVGSDSRHPWAVKRGAELHHHVCDTCQAGEHSSGELAERFGVARSTIYRTIERMNQPTVDRPGLGLTSAHRTR
ncbi:MAG: HTH domain-containing protein [Mycobacterium sp.]